MILHLVLSFNFLCFINCNSWESASGEIKSLQQNNCTDDEKLPQSSALLSDKVIATDDSEPSSDDNVKIVQTSPEEVKANINNSTAEDMLLRASVPSRSPPSFSSYESIWNPQAVLPSEYQGSSLHANEPVPSYQEQHLNLIENIFNKIPQKFLNLNTHTTTATGREDCLTIITVMYIIKEVLQFVIRQPHTLNLLINEIETEIEEGPPLFGLQDEIRSDIKSLLIRISQSIRFNHVQPNAKQECSAALVKFIKQRPDIHLEFRKHPWCLHLLFRCNSEIIRQDNYERTTQPESCINIRNLLEKMKIYEPRPNLHVPVHNYDSNVMHPPNSHIHIPEFNSQEGYIVNSPEPFIETVRPQVIQKPFTFKFVINDRNDHISNTKPKIQKLSGPKKISKILTPEDYLYPEYSNNKPESFPEIFETIDIEKPKPTNVEETEPIYIEGTESIHFDKPRDIFIEQPQPNYIEQPELKYIKKPETTSIKKPEYIYIEEAEPNYIKPSKIIDTEKLKPIYFENPELIHIEEPESIYIEPSQIINTEKLKPLYSEKPEPINFEELEQPEPNYINKPEPNYIEQPEPKYVLKPTPIIFEEPESTYLERPEPIYTGKPKPIYVDKHEPIYIAELETTHVEPKPVYVEQPDPNYIEQPKPIEHPESDYIEQSGLNLYNIQLNGLQPTPIIVGEPESLYIKHPEIIYTEKPKPMYVEKPEPIYIEEPESIYIEPSEVINTENLKPIYVKNHEPTYIEQPEPKYGLKPTPIIVEKPEATYIERPEPIYTGKPKPIYVEKHEPIYIAELETTHVEPKSIFVEQPEPNYIEQPKPNHGLQATPVIIGEPESIHIKHSEPIYTENPTPIYVEKPESIYIEQPEPMYPDQPIFIDQPAPINLKNHKYIYVQKPEPVINVAKPESFYIEEPKSIYVEQSKPIYIDTPKPIYGKETEPTYIEEPEPIYAEKLKPISVEESKPIYGETSKPIVYIGPESIYIEELRPDYTEEIISKENVPNTSQISKSLKILTLIKEGSIDYRAVEVILELLNQNKNNILTPSQVEKLLILLEPNKEGLIPQKYIDIASILVHLDTIKYLSLSSINTIFSLIPNKIGNVDDRAIEIIHEILLPKKIKYLTKRDINYMLSFLHIGSTAKVQNKRLDFVLFMLKNMAQTPRLTYELVKLSENYDIVHSKYVDIILYLHKRGLLNYKLLKLLISLVKQETTGNVDPRIINNVFLLLESYKNDHPKIEIDIHNILHPEYVTSPNKMKEVPENLKVLLYYLMNSGTNQFENVQVPQIEPLQKHYDEYDQPEDQETLHTNLLTKILQWEHNNESPPKPQAHDYGYIELTYLLKQQKPLLYHPVYYVKYKMPMVNFLTKVQELLAANPHFTTDPEKLLQELIIDGNVSAISPDLKGIPKEDILRLTFNDGNLIQAKILDEDSLNLNEQIKLIHNLNSDITAQEILQQNKMNEAQYYTNLRVNLPSQVNIGTVSSLTNVGNVDHSIMNKFKNSSLQRAKLINQSQGSRNKIPVTKTNKLLTRPFLVHSNDLMKKINDTEDTRETALNLN